MRIIIFVFLSLSVSFHLIAQASTAPAPHDTLAPYEKTPLIPSFKIQMPDSSWFYKTNLQPKKPTLIVYFSPDCGHCQSETQELLSKIKAFGNLQIVMITSRPFGDMINFAEHYKIKRFPGIKIGTDPARFVTAFYDVRTTPFSALYDSKGKLKKVYEKGIDMEELISLVN